MPYEVTRDFVGYGANPPDPQWPNGARLAVNFVMNYEEGSEPSIAGRRGITETGLTEAHGMGQTVKGRDLAAEGMFEYGSRVGFWRLMRLFQERGLPMTVFGCALAFERNPEAAAAIREAGYDICSPRLALDQAFELVRGRGARAHRARRSTSTEKMIGRGRKAGTAATDPSENTRRLVVEEGGFLYDSDYYGDELPFWLTVDGKPQLVVPYSLTNNDGKYVGRHRHRRPVVHAHAGRLRHALPRRRDPAEDDVGRHAHAPDRPSRPGRRPASGCWTTCRSTKGVWITRRVDIARHWIKTHPYPGKGLNE